MALSIREKPLPPSEYVQEATRKEIIFLHHTAGGHRPDWVVDGWMADRAQDGTRVRVATSYVVGGPSTSSPDTSWDGVVVRSFPDTHWAYHLKAKTNPSGMLDRKSIGIEICSYGELTRTADGRFLNYVNKEVPASLAVTLAGKFRGFQFYQRYSDKQLAAVKELLIQLAAQHSIDLRAGLPALLRKQRSAAAFEIQADALAGKPGLWTHTNVRPDKKDCFPQPELIDMLLSL